MDYRSDALASGNDSVVENPWHVVPHPSVVAALNQTPRSLQEEPVPVFGAARTTVRCHLLLHRLGWDLDPLFSVVQLEETFVRTYFFTLPSNDHLFLNAHPVALPTSRPALAVQNVPSRQSQNASVIRKIDDILDHVQDQRQRNENPCLEYWGPGTDWSDYRMDALDVMVLRQHGTKVHRISAGTPGRRFEMIEHLLRRIRQLLARNEQSTLRGLYYENTILFLRQHAANEALDTITLLLQVPRDHLNIFATDKSLVAGHVKMRDGEILIDCLRTHNGLLISSQTEHLEFVESDAEVVFIVEKDATFQSLVAEGICHRFKCIVVTGKGYPDVAVRRFLHKLWDAFQIPMYALTDSDPHGMDIMCTYRFGSRASYYGHLLLALPHVRWLGVLPSDLDLFRVPRDMLRDLSESDRAKARDILQRPYCSDAFRREVQIMLNSNQRAEMQSIQLIAHRYFVDSYLAYKLRDGPVL